MAGPILRFPLTRHFIADLKRFVYRFNDFIPHFVIRSNKESNDYPDGSVVFQLRSDHGGERR